MKHLFQSFVVIACVMTSRLGAAPTTHPASAPALPTIGQGVLLPAAARPVRGAIVADPVTTSIVHGDWHAPRDGDEVAAAEGRRARKWRSIEPTAGTFTDNALPGGWLYVPIDSLDERIVLLTATGHGIVYVNGEPRAGDPYAKGFVTLPIQLRAGRNDLLFAGARTPSIKIELSAPADDLSFSEADLTTPDFVRGNAEKLPAGIVAVNATTQPIRVKTSNDLPARVIAPLTVRKLGHMINYDGIGAGTFETTLTATCVDRPALVATQKLTLRALDPLATRKITFISKIDGSVQYYSVVPASDPTESNALVLSLHGADVEATSQAGAYSSKSWATIVCPTNRRAFGFDWEDWGRTDAFEVLDHAANSIAHDASRVYLTGHSMGGHGTWQIGSIAPNRFAAIGPSAGWLSFETYRGAIVPGTSQPTTATTAPAPDVISILRRASASSDTASLMPNLAPLGVYILHGEDDDNVPFTESKSAVSILEKFHHDYRLHAQPKAGHWWDVSPEPGADCEDWPPMFDFLARRRRPDNREILDIDFRTINPSVSSRFAWAMIDAQTRPMMMSRVQIHVDPHLGKFTATTENIARLRIDLSILPKSEKEPTIDIDGQMLTLTSKDQFAWLSRSDNRWTLGAAPSSAMKNAARSGTFKAAFDNRMIFVYGTHGSPEENAATYNKARFDSETWWYRGNGAVDLVSDDDPTWRAGDRNVIVYGNADTNAAWKELLADSPIQVKRGKIAICEREESGDDLACLFIRPRAGNDRAMVGVVSSTGAKGTRLGAKLPIFQSGAALSDWIIAGPEILTKGSRAARGAGLFGNDWTISDADSAWSAR